MPKDRLSPTQQLGGGGAKAPATDEPVILPGAHRPDWPTPDYANPETLKRAGTHRPGRRPRPPDKKS